VKVFAAYFQLFGNKICIRSFQRLLLNKLGKRGLLGELERAYPPAPGARNLSRELFLLLMRIGVIGGHLKSKLTTFALLHIATLDIWETSGKFRGPDPCMCSSENPRQPAYHFSTRGERKGEE